MPITVNEALIFVMIFLGFYVLFAWAILYLIGKRSKYPLKRRAQFVFALTLFIVALLAIKGLLDTWVLAMALPIFIFCGKFMNKKDPN